MKIQKKILAGLVACALAPSAFAATIELNPASVPGMPGEASAPIGIQFTGDGVTVGFEVEVAFDATSLQAVAAGANGGSCAANNATGVVTVQFVDGGLNPIVGPTVYCNMTFTVDGAVTVPEPGDPDVVFDLTLQNALYSDAAIQPVPGPHTETGGQIVVQGTPPDVNLTYNPPSGGTVTFTGGTSGDTVSASITVGATGTSGTGSVTACSLGGANPGAFAVTSTFPISVSPGGSDTIDIDCTLGNSAATATLSCTEDDTSVSNPSFNLSCPAGDPVPAPEFESNPAPGGTINCSGTPGSTQSRTLTITNDGFAGVGSTLSYSCSTGDAGFSVTGGATGDVEVGDSATVTIECTVPAEGDPEATGTLTCTSNDADEPSVDYALLAAPVTVPPPNPSPEIIPANSLWSLLALFGVMAGIGAVVVGMRRH